MNLHEYQSKRLFAEYGIPVPEGVAAETADAAALSRLQLSFALNGSLDQFNLQRLMIMLDESHIDGQVQLVGVRAYYGGPLVGHELQELRGVLKEITSQGFEPETRLLHFGPVKAPASVLKELRVNVKQLVLLERLYSLQDAPVGLIQTYFAPFSATVTWEQAETHRIYEIIEKLVGTPIGSADVSIRGRLAGREIAKVLKMPAKSPLLVFARLSLSRAGDPLELTKFHVKSENYEFTLKATGAMPLTSTKKEAV